MGVDNISPIKTRDIFADLIEETTSVTGIIEKRYARRITDIITFIVSKKCFFILIYRLKIETK